MFCAVVSGVAAFVDTYPPLPVIVNVPSSVSLYDGTSDITGVTIGAELADIQYNFLPNNAVGYSVVRNLNADKPALHGGRRGDKIVCRAKLAFIHIHSVAYITHVNRACLLYR